MTKLISVIRRSGPAAGLIGMLLLAGCVVAPPPRRVAPPPPPPAPAPVADVYAYATRGQTPEQQDRDHYECSLWASQQSGFDPAAPGVPAEERVRVVSGPPSGAGTAIGALTGAIIGAAISPRWQAAPGALAGAVVGGAIGTASDAANAQQTQTVLVTDRRAQAAQAQRAANYRRAIGACLDARGYSVR